MCATRKTCSEYRRKSISAIICRFLRISTITKTCGQSPKRSLGRVTRFSRWKPYFVIMKLPGEVKEEFVMLLPYTPNERQNLIGWLAARSDGDSYGNLIAYNFPKDRQIDGTRSD